MSEEYKYMLTCGHNSATKTCPHKCPEAKPLYRVKLVDGGYVRVSKAKPEPEPAPESEEEIDEDLE